MEQPKTSNQLPGEILEEILFTLPVKSLLRFKCVSKSWLSLLSSKEFIKNHLKKSNKVIDFSHCKLKLSPSNESPNNADVTSLFRDSNILNLRSLHSFIASLDNHFTSHPVSVVQVMGSCNGLVLMRINRSYLYLWNPSTREIRKVIPPFGCFIYGTSVYGLGYDEYTDDYKVVCIYITNTKTYPTDMYSSKSGLWKKIENLDKGCPIYDFGKLANGRLHWLVRRDGGMYLDIVSLDLVKEKYGIVPHPENYINHIYSLPLLNNLGGYLSLSGYSRNAWRDMNVWVMLKYGERESWTKIWTFSNYHNPMARIDVTSRKNGDIKVYFGYDMDMVVYNRKSGVCESRFDTLDAKNVHRSTFYVESLVSPNTIW